MIKILIEKYNDKEIKEIDDIDTDKQMVIIDEDSQIVIDNGYYAYVYKKDNIKKLILKIK